jgi:predicted RNA-binding Zn ribbon-like protein
VPVNPYTSPLLRNVTDLLNRPPESPSELEERWQSQGMPVPCPAGEDDLRRVRVFLRAWRPLVDADTDDERADVLNGLLRRFTERPSVSNHERTGWHLHYRDIDAGFAAMLAGATTAAAAHYLTERGMHRTRRCAREGCGNAFVDFTRPGTQKYCRHDCANRDAVRRHRARRTPVRS